MCAVGDHGGGVVRVITRTRRQAGQSRAILLWGGINALAVLTNLSRVHAYFQTYLYKPLVVAEKPRSLGNSLVPIK